MLFQIGRHGSQMYQQVMMKRESSLSLIAHIVLGSKCETKPGPNIKIQWLLRDLTLQPDANRCFLPSCFSVLQQITPGHFTALQGPPDLARSNWSQRLEQAVIHQTTLSWLPGHSGTKIWGTQVIELPLVAIWSPLKSERSISKEDGSPGQIWTHKTDKSNPARLEFFCSLLSPFQVPNLTGLSSKTIHSDPLN